MAAMAAPEYDRGVYTSPVEKRRRTCKMCGRDRAECGPISARRKCHSCSMAAVVANAQAQWDIAMQLPPKPVRARRSKV